ncbi:MAG: hypothetical protein QXD77_01930 [Candidatus Aenigmatarchaeota archaeon]
MDGKLFWIISAALLAAIGLAFKGYDATLAALGLVLLALITLKFSIDKAGGMSKDIRSELGGRLSSLDGMVQDLTKAFKDQADIKDFTLGALEKMKGEIRTEVKVNLDKMAEKTIEMENSMNQMKRTFSAAFASLDDRVRSLEPQANNLVAQTGNLAPEIKLQGAEDSYVELGNESGRAE